MTYCGSCGTAAGPGLRFCTSCGASLQPTGQAAPPASPPPAWPAAEVPPAPADSVFARPALSPPWGAGAGPGESEPVTFWEDASAESPSRSRTPLVIGGVVLAALLAAGGGYVVADQLFGSDPVADASDPDEDLPGGAAEGGDAPAPPAGDDPVRPRSVTATCQAPPGVDAAGAPVTYEPGNTLDGVGGTAWRCPGAAVGQQLVFDFGRPVTLGSVGLVPGYDKVDPVDGTDRFVENRTVTGVIWRFDDDTEHRQDIASPTRAVASSELDEPVTTSRVVLEIVRTGNDGAVRDFTTVSDVAFTGSG